MSSDPAPPPAPAASRGARRLHRLLVALSLLGVALPLVTLVLKASAEDFQLWRNWRDANPSLGDLARSYPILDIENSMPFLADVSWHHPHETPYLRIYLSHCALNAALLLLQLVFRRRILRWLQPAVAWIGASDHRGPRRIVTAFALGILFLYQCQSTAGFYFPGIGGWTYSKWRASRREALAPDPAEERVPTAAERAFLDQAIVWENAEYIPGPGFISGRAMFFHYADGSLLPGSYEMTDMVFPHYFFGGKHVRIDHPDVFAKVVRNALGYRYRGKRLLLPLEWSYPNHAVYSPIDYSTYPDPTTLERISFWKLTLEFDGEGSVELVSALNHYEIALPGPEESE